MNECHTAQLTGNLLMVSSYDRKPIFYRYQDGALVKFTGFFHPKDLVINGYHKVYVTEYEKCVFVYEEGENYFHRFAKALPKSNNKIVLLDFNGDIWSATIERTDPYIHETFLVFNKK
jgi:hypothetical protein